MVKESDWDMLRAKFVALTLLLSWCLPVTAIVALGAQGCAAHNIPDTDVTDTDFNRDVIEFCEGYRKAVESRRIGALASLAAPSYYEDGGNSDASDDMGLEEFKASLKNVFSKAKAIRYEMRYRRIGRGEKNQVYVDYTYSASYKVATDRGDIWRRRVADNRLELIEHGGSFQIISGM